MWARINHLSQKSVIFRKAVGKAQIPAFCYTIPLTRGVFQFWECWGILSRGYTKGIWDQYDSYHTTWILQHIETCTSVAYLQAGKFHTELAGTECFHKKANK